MKIDPVHREATDSGWFATLEAVKPATKLEHDEPKRDKPSNANTHEQWRKRRRWPQA